MGRYRDHQQAMIARQADLRDLEHRRVIAAGKTLSASERSLQAEVRRAVAKARLQAHARYQRAVERERTEATVRLAFRHWWDALPETDRNRLWSAETLLAAVPAARTHRTLLTSYLKACGWQAHRRNDARFWMPPALAAARTEGVPSVGMVRLNKRRVAPAPAPSPEWE